MWGRNINVVFNNGKFYQWYANKLFCVNNTFYHFQCFLNFVFPITCLILHFSLCIHRCLFRGWIRVLNDVLEIGHSSLFVLFHGANISVAYLVVQFVYQDSAEEFSCFGVGCNVVCWSCRLALLTFPAVESTYEFIHPGLNRSTSLSWPHLQRCYSHPASSFTSCPSWVMVNQRSCW